MTDIRFSTIDTPYKQTAAHKARQNKPVCFRHLSIRDVPKCVRISWHLYYITGRQEKQSIDFTKELTYFDRKALHNLKYYTWVEQQGKTVEQINELWNPDFWEDIFENEITYFDQLIEEFNQIVEKS